MPDQVQNPNIKFQDPGLAPATPGIEPVAPSAPVPPAPTVPSGPGLGQDPAASNPAPVEPVPLPKVTDPTDSGGKLPAAEVKTGAGMNMEAAKEVVEPANPLFEIPKISPPKAAPGTAEKSAGDDFGRKKILKVMIAGAAGFFVLVSGAVAGLNLVRRQGAGEIRKLAGTGLVPTLAVTPTTSTTPTTISANCDSLAAQISDGSGSWTTKTDIEFAALARPGVKVRFICTGAKPNGNFTKSAFLINNVLYADEVVKLNETQFAVEYVIEASGALKVESVLLHDSKGWVD